VEEIDSIAIMRDNINLFREYYQDNINKISQSQEKMADKQRFVEENVSSLNVKTDKLLDIAMKTERHIDMEDTKNIHNRLKDDIVNVEKKQIALSTRIIIYGAIGIFAIGIIVKIIVDNIKV